MKTTDSCLRSAWITAVAIAGAPARAFIRVCADISSDLVVKELLKNTLHDLKQEIRIIEKYRLNIRLNCLS